MTKPPIADCGPACAYLPTEIVIRHIYLRVDRGTGLNSG